MSKTIFSKTTNASLTGNSAPTDAITMYFENDESAILPAGHPLSMVWKHTIEYLHSMDLPAYVTVDDNNVVTDVLLTIIDKVREVVENDERALVTMESIDTMYYVPRDQPHYEAMVSALQEAIANQGYVYLSLSYNKIISVQKALGYVPEVAATEKPSLQHIPINTNNLTHITPERAKTLFAEMLAPNCTTDHSYKTTCIPFRFPAGGCWVRAHLMCYMMMAEKIVPGKVWCFSSGKNMLTAKTDNDWNCSVSWDFHVAPVVSVIQKDGTNALMVLDPSLCSGPVTPEQWQGMMDRGGSNLIYSDWKQYERFSGSATHNRTNKDMNAYRLLLDKMSAEHGMPPYAKCGRNG